MRIFPSSSAIGLAPFPTNMKRLAAALSIIASLAWGHAVFAAANVTPTGAKQVRVGQTFNVVIQTSGAVDVDTIRINGSYTNDLIEWRGAKPAGVFQNISPGTFSDQAKGIFSFGAFTLSSKANGTTPIAVLTFRAKKTGTAYVQLTTNSRMLAAGEEQIGAVGRLTFTIVDAPETPEQPRVLTPTEFGISLLSTSHPDPNIWYPDRTVLARWEVQGKKTKFVYLGFDEAPEGKAETPVVENLAKFIAPTDGTYYVHLTVHFEDETVAREHLRVHIDTTKPLAIYPTVDQTLVRANIPNFLRYGSIDNESGIAKYNIFLDGVFVTSTTIQAYELANQAPGFHVARVEAYDQAGNSVAGHATFEILPDPVIPEKVNNWIYVLIGSGILALILFIWLLVKRRRSKKSRRR